MPTNFFSDNNVKISVIKQKLWKFFNKTLRQVPESFSKKRWRNIAIYIFHITSHLDFIFTIKNMKNVKQVSILLLCYTFFKTLNKIIVLCKIMSFYFILLWTRGFHKTATIYFITVSFLLCLINMLHFLCPSFDCIDRGKYNYYLASAVSRYFLGFLPF